MDGRRAENDANYCWGRYRAAKEGRLVDEGREDLVHEGAGIHRGVRQPDPAVVVPGQREGLGDPAETEDDAEDDPARAIAHREAKIGGRVRMDDEDREDQPEP